MYTPTENRAVSHAVRWALACGLTASFAFAGSAMAAEQSQATTTSPATETNNTTAQLKAVTVTGTKIKRTSVEQSQPIQVVTSAQIKQSGLTTIGEVLQSITSSGSALNTQQDLGGNQFGYHPGGGGQTNLNLRFLGANRTLVLVNGHRWATDISGAVDLDTIPASIIDHIEILEDGASAIYGSDAVAGVVNIITIKNFQGGEANAYTGIYHGDGHWDGLNQNANIIMGASSDRGNIVFGASYTNQRIIPAEDRDLSAIPTAGTGTTRFISSNPQGSFKFIPPDTGPITSPNNAPLPSTGLTAAECPAKNYGTTSKPNWLPFCFLTTGVGKRGTSVSDLHAYNQATDGYNYALFETLMSPAEHTGLYVHGSLNLTDNLTLQVTGSADRRDSMQWANPSSAGIGSSQSVTFEPGDPYYPFNFKLATAASRTAQGLPAIGPGLLQSVAKRQLETGPRVTNVTGDVSYLNAELDGFFDTGGSEWDWDVGGAYSRNDLTNKITALPDSNRLAIQLNPAQCKPIEKTQGCVPINFFGGQTVPNTPKQLAFSVYTSNVLFGSNMNNVYADITNSDIGSLPGGPIGFAAGYQHLGNSAFYQPSAASIWQATIVQGVKTHGTSGSNSSEAAYVEFNFPFLSNAPFFKLLNLDVASRYTRTDAAGIHNHNTSSRAGLKWQPTDAWLFRANWSQAFRAPDISELFAGVSSGGGFGTDPCSNYTQSGVPADVQQRCAAAGVPPGYVQALPQLSTEQYGNPDLKPETAVSRTVGFVYSPDWLSGFNMNMDYYKIEVDNAIQTEQAFTILDNCYFRGISSACSKVIRNPDGLGDIYQMKNPETNIGGDIIKGADIGFTYAFQTSSIGNFEVGLQGSWIQSYQELYPNPGGKGFVTQQLVGKERGGSTYPFGMPRWKADGNVTWTEGPWKATWQLHYISGMMESCSDFLDGTPISLTNLGLCSNPDHQNNSLSQNYLGRTIYNDLQAVYNYSPWNTSFTFGIKNVFDKAPPVCNSCALSSMDTTIYRVSGRLFYASVGIKF